MLDGPPERLSPIGPWVHTLLLQYKLTILDFRVPDVVQEHLYCLNSCQIALAQVVELLGPLGAAPLDRDFHIVAGRGLQLDISEVEDQLPDCEIGPDDIDLAELHDCFTITELLTYEDMGFCKKGEGGKWIEEGHPTLNGTKPCNPSGGLKAKGHPIGATGVAQICELWWHLRGEAGERQVKDAQIGCTHNLGGLGTVVLVNIFGKEPR